jgi:hypothetical protein
MTDTTTTFETLDRLALSGDKVQVFFRLDDGDPKPLVADGRPVQATWARESVATVVSVAEDLGMTASFTVRRYED